MLTHDYSYPEILQNSLKVAWTESEVLDGRDFDYSKRFLPNRLSGVDGIRCLNDREKLKLNQIMEAAIRKVRAEGFLIPRAATEARSLSELRLIVFAASESGFRDGSSKRRRAEPS